MTTALLAKTYGGTLAARARVEALKGLDLEVMRGRVFGLLGPNGAGKTTLVKLLLGIAFPTAGRALVLGRPPGDVRARERIGYLPESHRYPAHLTGAQVLRFFGMLSGVRRGEIAARVEALLRRVRLAEWAAMRVRKYSKGMLQRLGMAQALINRPDLLILDEPTDGVDPIGRREIRDLLIEEKDRGTTIFLNSHLLSEVERLCDQVAILKEGRLVRAGGIDDLTRPSGGYRIETRGLRPEVAAALKQEVPGLAAPPAAAAAPDASSSLDLTGDLETLNRLIDALRNRGVAIAAVVPRRDSLEDVFVKVVGDEPAPPPVPGARA